MPYNPYSNDWEPTTPVFLTLIVIAIIVGFFSGLYFYAPVP